MSKVKYSFGAGEFFLSLVVLFIIASLTMEIFIPPIVLNGILNVRYLYIEVVTFIPTLAISKIPRLMRITIYLAIILLLTAHEIRGTYNYMKNLPIKTGMNIEEVRKIIGRGEGRLIGKKGGFAKIEDHPYSSRKITNYCEYYRWESMTYLLVYIDEKQQVEHLFIVPTR